MSLSKGQVLSPWAPELCLGLSALLLQVAGCLLK